ncbi:hypothetical protein NM208_g10602 [Fusarium decemcellulare]|uniref:Uncharacterized protein n=1 Tax=Fusarium decemcellulare TaxID=57161 RepID=A0ACC1RXA7_9HYPO|nr:hypothetical protein NM208_g10602 [Fusarium decemcellulare]
MDGVGLKLGRKSGTGETDDTADGTAVDITRAGSSIESEYGMLVMGTVMVERPKTRQPHWQRQHQSYMRRLKWRHRSQVLTSLCCGISNAFCFGEKRPAAGVLAAEEGP